MSNQPVSIDIRSIGSASDLLRLAEEVKATNTPKILTKDDETLAVLVPVGTADVADEEVFEQLCTNARFVAEAEEARKSLSEDPSQFTDLTEKYSHLIKS